MRCRDNPLCGLLYADLDELSEPPDKEDAPQPMVAGERLIWRVGLAGPGPLAPPSALSGLWGVGAEHSVGGWATRRTVGRLQYSKQRNDGTIDVKVVTVPVHCWYPAES